MWEAILAVVWIFFELILPFWAAAESAGAVPPASPSARTKLPRSSLPIARDARCPVCAEPAIGTLRTCGDCGTPHHDECWRYNGCCAVFACGCKRADRLVRAQPAPGDPQERAAVRRAAADYTAAAASSSRAPARVYARTRPA